MVHLIVVVLVIYLELYLEHYLILLYYIKYEIIKCFKTFRNNIPNDPRVASVDRPFIVVIAAVTVAVIGEASAAVIVPDYNTVCIFHY